MLLADTKSNPQEEFRNLQTQLEAMENREVVAKHIYNDICIEHKRLDLIFDNPQKKKPPQVSN